MRIEQLKIVRKHIWKPKSHLKNNSRKLKLRGLRRSPDVEKVNESRTVVDFGEDRVPVREPLLTTSKLIGLFLHTVALPCSTLSPLIH